MTSAQVETAAAVVDNNQPLITEVCEKRSVSERTE
jgi:hypothetical protein